jgi:hypothetical protein
MNIGGVLPERDSLSYHRRRVPGTRVSADGAPEL